MFYLISDYIQSLGIEDVFTLCTRGELHKYRAMQLVEKLEDKDIAVHQHSFPDGTAPNIGVLVRLLDQVSTVIKNGHKCLLQ